MTAVTAESLRWQDLAVCQSGDLDLFFGPDDEPEPARDIRERKAKRICATCPVITACLGHALDNLIRSGVWGGMGEKGREAHRKAAQRRARIAGSTP